MTQRYLLAVNPRSRNGASCAGLLMAAVREAGAVVFGEHPVDVRELPGLLREHRASLHPGADRILVAGGDGTINRLLPYLVEAHLPLGIIPTGTANDLARTLGLSDDPAIAIAVALRGRVVRIDLGRVNGRLFANVANLGLGAQVTGRLSSSLKASAGALSYPRALLAAYDDSRPFRCRISIDDGPERRLRVIHLAVGNGRFYGGGAVIAEDAAIDDRRLDLYGLSPIPLWRLLLMAPWLARGRHRELQDVHVLSGRRMSVRTSRTLEVSADGELITQTPAEFDLLPGALPVIVGAESPLQAPAMDDDAAVIAADGAVVGHPAAVSAGG